MDGAMVDHLPLSLLLALTVWPLFLIHCQGLISLSFRVKNAVWEPPSDQ